MDGFKHRIIGALVLISLAVIFVPMLLDEPHEQRTTRSIEIPEEPAFPEVRIEPAEPPVTTDPIEPVPEPSTPPLEITDSQGAVEAEPFMEEAPVSPASRAGAIPETPAEAPISQRGGFLVQLGSFSSGDNAKRLQGTVSEAGFNSFTTEIQSDGKTFTRVFAGPFPQRSAASAAKAKLDDQFGLNTLVIVNDE